MVKNKKTRNKTHNKEYRNYDTDELVLSPSSIRIEKIRIRKKILMYFILILTQALFMNPYIVISITIN